MIARYKLALSFLDAANQYLRLVENSADEISHAGNPHVLVDDDGETITNEAYDRRTRWSDHAVILPVLFNLLHGIELLLKGFVFVDPAEDPRAVHNSKNLFRLFKNKYPDESLLIEFVEKYVDETSLPLLIRRFLKKNNLTIEKMYGAIRYPADNKFTTMVKYSSLKYNEKLGAKFFMVLSKDIHAVRLASVRLGQSIFTVTDVKQARLGPNPVK